jgi:hypothetical protein
MTASLLVDGSALINAYDRSEAIKLAQAQDLLEALQEFRLTALSGRCYP